MNLINDPWQSNFEPMSLNDMDYSIATQHLKQADAALASVIERVGDCRLDRSQGTGDLFFSLTESILYQQLSGKAAAAIHRRFLQLYGDQPFPTPTDLLNTPTETLREVGISRSKIIYLTDLAQKILDGLPSLDLLEPMEDEAIIQTLTAVKGVGRWTAQMILIFRLHRWDVLPVDDLGVRSGIQKLYALETLPNKTTVEKIGHPWKPYRSIASWYVWRSLEKAPTLVL